MQRNLPAAAEVLEEEAEQSPCMSSVRSGLYVGNIQAVTDSSILFEARIGYVITVAAGDWPEIPNVERLQFHIFDEEDEDLIAVIPEAIDFTKRALLARSCVLIHCVAGISRSAAVAAACLMDIDGLTADEAQREIQARHPISSPNAGFLRQLRLLEGMGGNLFGTSEHHRNYRQLRTSRLLRAGTPFSEMNHLANTSTVRGPYKFSCKVCGMLLFSSCNVITSSASEVEIEPMEWMFLHGSRSSTTTTEKSSNSRIVCQQCASKLGSLVQSKPAQIALSAAVRITTSRVDHFLL